MGVRWHLTHSIKHVSLVHLGKYRLSFQPFWTKNWMYRELTSSSSSSSSNTQPTGVLMGLIKMSNLLFPLQGNREEGRWRGGLFKLLILQVHTCTRRKVNGDRWGGGNGTIPGIQGPQHKEKGVNTHSTLKGSRGPVLAHTQSLTQALYTAQEVT